MSRRRRPLRRLEAAPADSVAPGEQGMGVPRQGSSSRSSRPRLAASTPRPENPSALLFKGFLDNLHAPTSTKEARIVQTITSEHFYTFPRRHHLVKFFIVAVPKSSVDLPWSTPCAGAVLPNLLRLLVRLYCQPAPTPGQLPERVLGLRWDTHVDAVFIHRNKHPWVLLSPVQGLCYLLCDIATAGFGRGIRPTAHVRTAQAFWELVRLLSGVARCLVRRAFRASASPSGRSSDNEDADDDVDMAPVDDGNEQRGRGRESDVPKNPFLFRLSQSLCGRETNLRVDCPKHADSDALGTSEYDELSPLRRLAEVLLRILSLTLRRVRRLMSTDTMEMATLDVPLLLPEEPDGPRASFFPLLTSALLLLRADRSPRTKLEAMRLLSCLVDPTLGLSSSTRWQLKNLLPFDWNAIARTEEERTFCPFRAFPPLRTFSATHLLALESSIVACLSIRDSGVRSMEFDELLGRLLCGFLERLNYTRSSDVQLLDFVVLGGALVANCGDFIRITTSLPLKRALLYAHSLYMNVILGGAVDSIANRISFATLGQAYSSLVPLVGLFGDGMLQTTLIRCFQPLFADFPTPSASDGLTSASGAAGNASSRKRRRIDVGNAGFPTRKRQRRLELTFRRPGIAGLGGMSSRGSQRLSGVGGTARRRSSGALVVVTADDVRLTFGKRLRLHSSNFPVWASLHRLCSRKHLSLIEVCGLLRFLASCERSRGGTALPVALRDQPRSELLSSIPTFDVLLTVLNCHSSVDGSTQWVDRMCLLCALSELIRSESGRTAIAESTRSGERGDWVSFCLQKIENSPETALSPPPGTLSVSTMVSCLLLDLAEGLGQRDRREMVITRVLAEFNRLRESRPMESLALLSHRVCLRSTEPRYGRFLDLFLEGQLSSIQLGALQFVLQRRLESVGIPDAETVFCDQLDQLLTEWTSSSAGVASDRSLEERCLRILKLLPMFISKAPSPPEKLLRLIFLVTNPMSVVRSAPKGVLYTEFHEITPRLFELSSISLLTEFRDAFIFAMEGFDQTKHWRRGRWTMLLRQIAGEIVLRLCGASAHVSADPDEECRFEDCRVIWWAFLKWSSGFSGAPKLRLRIMSSLKSIAASLGDQVMNLLDVRGKRRLLKYCGDGTARFTEAIALLVPRKGVAKRASFIVPSSSDRGGIGDNDAEMPEDPQLLNAELTILRDAFLACFMDFFKKEKQAKLQKSILYLQHLINRSSLHVVDANLSGERSWTQWTYFLSMWPLEKKSYGSEKRQVFYPLGARIIEYAVVQSRLRAESTQEPLRSRTEIFEEIERDFCSSLALEDASVEGESDRSSSSRRFRNLFISVSSTVFVGLLAREEPKTADLHFLAERHCSLQGRPELTVTVYVIEHAMYLVRLFRKRILAAPDSHTKRRLIKGVILTANFFPKQFLSGVVFVRQIISGVMEVFVRGREAAEDEVLASCLIETLQFYESHQKEVLGQHIVDLAELTAQSMADWLDFRHRQDGVRPTGGAFVNAAMNVFRFLLVLTQSRAEDTGLSKTDKFSYRDRHTECIRRWGSLRLCPLPQAEIRISRQPPFEEALEQFTRELNDNASPATHCGTLRCLRDFLLSSSENRQRFVAQKSERLNKLLSALFERVCDAARVAEKAMDCLGLLGALDPSRVELRGVRSDATDPTLQDTLPSDRLKHLPIILLKLILSNGRLTDFGQYVVQELQMIALESVPKLLKQSGLADHYQLLGKRRQFAISRSMKSVQPKRRSIIKDVDVSSRQCMIRWQQLWMIRLLPVLKNSQFYGDTANVRIMDVVVPELPRLPQAVTFRLFPLLADFVIRSHESDHQSIHEILREFVDVFELFETARTLHFGDLVKEIFRLIISIETWAEAEIADRASPKKDHLGLDFDPELGVSVGPLRVQEFLRRLPLMSMAKAARVLQQHSLAVRFLEKDAVRLPPAPASDEIESVDEAEKIIATAKLDADRMSLLGEVASRVDQHGADLIAGIAPLRMAVPTLRERILEREAEEDWSAAAKIYDVVLRRDPDSLETHEGQMNCALQLGRLHSLMEVVTGKLHTYGGNEYASELFLRFGLKAAWRLSRWEQVDEWLQHEHCDQADFEVALSRCLLQLERVIQGAETPELGEEMLEGAMLNARHVLWPPLKQRCAVSYHSALETMVQLQMIGEIRQTAEMISREGRDESGGLPQQAFDKLQKVLDANFRSCSSACSYFANESLLLLRRTVFMMLGQKQAVVKEALRLSRVASTAHKFVSASMALSFAKRYIPPEAVLAQTASLEAKLFWATGRHRDALRLLQSAGDALQDDVSSGKIELRLLRWQEELAAIPQGELRQRYEVLMQKLGGDMDEVESAGLKGDQLESSFFFLARCIDRIGQAQKAEIAPFGIHGSSNVEDASTREAAVLRAQARLDLAEQFDLPAIRYYLKSLMMHRSKRMPIAMPRWLTMLCLVCDDYVLVEPLGRRKTAGRERVQQQRIDAFVRDEVKMMVKGITQLEFIASQLFTRLAHTMVVLRTFVQDLVLQLLTRHSDRLLWRFRAPAKANEPLARGAAPARLQIAAQIAARTTSFKDLLVKLRTKGRAQREMVDAAKVMFEVLQCLPPASLKKNPPRRKKKDDDEDETALYLKSNLHKINTAMQLMSDSKFVMPLFSSLYYSVGSGFALSPPLLGQFVNQFERLLSLRTPLKFVILSTDNVKYDYAYKRDDDPRKDERILELFHLVNWLMRTEHLPARDFSLRTFAVVIVSEVAMVVEWVKDSATLKSVIKRQAVLHRAKDPFAFGRLINTFIRNPVGELGRRGKRQEYRQFHRAALRTYRSDFLARWHLARFVEPAEWLDRRQGYVKAKALMDMLGMVVALGDRHCDNLLVDDYTGQLIHIDFDCTYYKGLRFGAPERVPFRLTRSLVAAMGITGVEGTYRHACERVLGVLRQRSEAVVTQMETMVHDPLMEMIVQPHELLEDIKRRLQGFYTDRYSVADAVLAMKRGEGRRDIMGAIRQFSVPLPLSVAGHVAALIKAATSTDCLELMFPHWGAHV